MKKVKIAIRLVTENVDNASLGLSGNIYRNQKYLFKISNLPVNEWSIFCADYPKQKEIINIYLYGEKDYVPDTSFRSNIRKDLLLLSPGKNVSADDLRQMYEGNKEIYIVSKDINSNQLYFR